MCAMSGVGGAFIFPGFSKSLLAWIVLVPLLLVLRDLKGRALAWGTLLFAFPWNYLSLWWLNTLTAFNPFIPAGVILLALVQTAFFAAFTFPASFALRRLPPWLSPYVVASLWAGMEYMRGLSDFAFPWNYLGHSQAPDFLEVIQFADLCGVFGVSWLIALTNAMAAQLWRAERDGGNQRLHLCPPGIAALVLWVALWGGLTVIYPQALRPIRTASAETSGSLRLAIVQPNVSQVEKVEYYDTEDDRRRMEIEAGMARTLFTMMRDAGDRGVRLFVLPEAAIVSTYFVYDAAFHKVIGDFAGEIGADILFGADRREPVEEYKQRLRRPDSGHSTRSLPQLAVGTDDRGNTVPCEPGRMVVTVAAWQAKRGDGFPGTVYDKMRLVPFGETAPVFDQIPFFQEHIMMVGTFGKGTEHTIFETDGARYGVMICFESSFSGLAREIARRGANMICVITNDAWYDPAYLLRSHGFWGFLFRLPVLGKLAASGPEQHFVQSVFRAVETRLPVVRAANSGISAVIDPSGASRLTIPWGTRETLVADVGLSNSPPTFYTRHGDLLAQACLALLMAMLAWQAVAAHADRVRCRGGNGLPSTG